MGRWACRNHTITPGSGNTGTQNMYVQSAGQSTCSVAWCCEQGALHRCSERYQTCFLPRHRVWACVYVDAHFTNILIVLPAIPSKATFCDTSRPPARLLLVQNLAAQIISPMPGPYGITFGQDQPRLEIFYSVSSLPSLRKAATATVV